MKILSGCGSTIVVLICIILISSLLYNVDSRRLKRWEDNDRLSVDDEKLEQEVMASIAQDLLEAQQEVNRTEQILSTLPPVTDTTVQNVTSSINATSTTTPPPPTTFPTSTLVTEVVHSTTYHNDTTTSIPTVETETETTTEDNTSATSDNTWDSNWRQPETVTKKIENIEFDADRQRELADLQREEGERIRADADRQREDAEKIRETYNI